MSEYGFFPVLARGFFFWGGGVLGVWLVYSTTLLMFQKNTVLPVLVYPHFT